MILGIDAKCGDRCSIVVEGPEWEHSQQVTDGDYVPRELGIGGGDYIHFQIDVATGTILNWDPEMVTATVHEKLRRQNGQ